MKINTELASFHDNRHSVFYVCDSHVPLEGLENLPSGDASF